jgi:hypothetical protein
MIMAVTRESRSITLAADNDHIAGRFLVSEMHAVCDGATPGDIVEVQDTDTEVIARGVVEVANGNLVLIQNCGWYDGIRAAVLPTGVTLFVITK